MNHLFDFIDAIPERVRSNMITGLTLFIAASLFLLWHYRTRFCRVCERPLSWKERGVDAEGNDVCPRHQPKDQRDDDFTDNPHI